MTTTARLRRLAHWAFGTRLFATALLALAFVPPAHAIATSGTSAAPRQDADSDLLGAQEIRQELDSFRAAQISLRQAMAIAEALHAGSITADVSFDGGSEPAVYRIKTVQQDRVWQQAINAYTGKVEGGQAAAPLTELADEDRSNLLVLRALRHRLTDAVRVAEHAAHGKAISGGLIRDGGKLNFIIVVVNGTDLKQVILEPPGVRRR